VIVDGFLAMIYGLLHPLIIALPSVESASDLPWGGSDGALNNAAQFLASVDRYVPIIAPLQFLWVILMAWSALLAFRLGVFVWGLVRG